MQIPSAQAGSETAACASTKPQDGGSVQLMSFPNEILDMIIGFLIPNHWNGTEGGRSCLRLRLVCSKPARPFASSCAIRTGRKVSLC